MAYVIKICNVLKSHEWLHGSFYRKWCLDGLFYVEVLPQKGEILADVMFLPQPIGAGANKCQ